METDIKQHLITVYLDYVNNWLTFERMAEAYGMRELDMKIAVQLGKSLHEQSLEG